MVLATQTVRLQPSWRKRFLQLASHTSNAWLDVLLVITVVVILGLYKWSALADFEAPPGGDPGNWLRLAHALVGEGARSAEITYPPVLPAVLRVLMVPFDALLAVKLMGIGVSVAPVVPVFLLVRRHMPAIFAAPLALTASLAGFQEEALAWGGYTQLLAVTFLLFSMYCLDSWFISLRRRDMWLSACFTALAIGTSHLVALNVLVVLALYWLLAGPLRLGQGTFVAFKSFKSWLIATCSLSMLFSPWYIYMAILTAGGATPVKRGVFDHITYAHVFQEGQGFWLGLLALSAGLTFVDLKDSGLNALRRTAASLFWGSFLVFAVSGETRHLQITQVAMILFLALLVAKLIGAARSLNSRHAHQAAMLGALAFVVAFLVAVAIPGDKRLNSSIEYYQAVEPRSIEAFDFLRLETPVDSVVVAGTSPIGVPYGWWIEGYSQRKTLTEMDPLLLFYKNEREQVYAVRHLLDPTTPAVEVKEILDSKHITHLFIDRDNNLLFKALLARIDTCPVFDNGRYVILEIEGSEPCGEVEGLE